MDDHTQEVMFRCMHVPSIIAVGPTVSGNWSKKKKKKKKKDQAMDREI